MKGLKIDDDPVILYKKKEMNNEDLSLCIVYDLKSAIKKKCNIKKMKGLKIDDDPAILYKKKGMNNEEFISNYQKIRKKYKDLSLYIVYDLMDISNSDVKDISVSKNRLYDMVLLKYFMLNPSLTKSDYSLGIFSYLKQEEIPKEMKDSLRKVISPKELQKTGYMFCTLPKNDEHWSDSPRFGQKWENISCLTALLNQSNKEE